MEFIEVRCTNCGARIRDVRPDQRVVHCTRHGCGASFVMDQGRQFAQVEEREAEEIRTLRAALEASLEPFSRETEVYAERIAQLIPGDFRAAGALAVCEMKRGNAAPLRQLLRKRRACTEEEFQEVFALVLRQAGVRELLDLEDALEQYVEDEEQRRAMRALVVRTREEKQRLEEVYADVPRDVFICYSTAQQAVADRVVRELEADGNVCWISARNLPPETPHYWEEIERALRRCQVFLVLCSMEAMYSPDVKHELALAEEIGLKRLELKLDDVKHTTLFRHFFDGLSWIAVDGDLDGALQQLKERVFRELHMQEEQERLERERQEGERREAERLEAERREQERQEAERREAERLERERQEQERLERERQEVERREADRQERERQERERQEAERLKREHQEAEHLEAERQERERQEFEQQRQEQKERLRMALGVAVFLLLAALFVYLYLIKPRMDNSAAIEAAEAAAAVEEAAAAGEETAHIAEQAPTPSPSLSSTPATKPEDEAAFIVPFGSTQQIEIELNSDGTLHEADDGAPFERVVFDVTIGRYLTNDYYIDAYSTTYRLSGTEASVELKLMLRDYRGALKVDPNCLNIVLESADGVRETGYKLTDAEIQGKSDFVLTTNVETLLYKRFDYSPRVGDMKYLVMTAVTGSSEKVYKFELGTPVRYASALDPSQSSAPASKPGYEAGSIVRFGCYEQDGVSSNGLEEIEWLVLANDGETAMLISRYALDCVSYNKEYMSVTWETCSLRKWLNNDFLNSAFSAEERARLATVTVSADANPETSTDPGQATQDKVFLPSIVEVNKYFASDSARVCKPTEYAEGQGVLTSSSGACWWWLRSPGYFSYRAARVHSDGSVGCSGRDVDGGNGAVRPVVALRLTD